MSEKGARKGGLVVEGKTWHTPVNMAITLTILIGAVECMIERILQAHLGRLLPSQHFCMAWTDDPRHDLYLQKHIRPQPAVFLP